MAVAQHVGQLEPGLVEERGQVLIAVGSQFGDDLGPAVPDLAPDVLQHDLLRLPVHDDLAARRQEREAALDVAFQSAAGLPGQGPQPMVEAELLAVVPDEVQDRQNRLVPGSTKPTAELLQEQRRALGGAQEQHRVDVGNVQALVEEVGGEQGVQLAGRASPASAWARSPRASRR